MAVANPLAGEVALTIDGQRHVMKLTLGALAELERQLGDDTLLALVERFETSQMRSKDIMALLLAGLRGGGWAGQAADLATADIAGGPVVAMRCAAELLVRAFAEPVAQSGHGGGYGGDHV